MCSLHLTHPSVHTWSSGQPTVQRPGADGHRLLPNLISFQISYRIRKTFIFNKNEGNNQNVENKVSGRVRE